jgi:Cdc6-like AAA superfamily ATPase
LLSPSERNLLTERVYKVYTPSGPVDSEAMFAGRQDAVMQLRHAVRTAGIVGIVTGDRGVGKTSLAKHTAKLFSREFRWHEPLFKGCDRQAEFSDLFAIPLREVGIDLSVRNQQKEQNNDRSAGLGIGPVRVALGDSATELTVRNGPRENASLPDWVASTLAPLERIFVLDEFDILEKKDTVQLVGDFIKHLGNYSPKFKIVITGIARNAKELLDAHGSNRRQLREVHLARMTNEEIETIVRNGASEIGVDFDSDGIRDLVSVSVGYPYYAHKIAQDACLYAIGSGRRDVTANEIRQAIANVFTTEEYALKQSYEQSIARDSEGQHAEILFALTYSHSREFKAHEVVANYRRFVRGRATDQSVRSTLAHLASDDGSKMLRRIAPGTYEFSDPRMPTYIRLAHSARALR